MVCDVLCMIVERPSVCLNVFGAEINLPSIDPNKCRKSTSTIKSACRPNLNSSKKNSGQSPQPTKTMASPV